MIIELAIGIAIGYIPCEHSANILQRHALINLLRRGQLW